MKRNAGADNSKKVVYYIHMNVSACVYFAVYLTFPGILQRRINVNMLI